MVHSIVLLIESILFGLFVVAIGCDQLGAIITDETAIEQVAQSLYLSNPTFLASS